MDKIYYLNTVKKRVSEKLKKLFDKYYLEGKISKKQYEEEAEPLSNTIQDLRAEIKELKKLNKQNERN